MACMFYFARCMNIIFNSLLAHLVIMMFIQLENKIHTRHFYHILLFKRRGSATVNDRLRRLLGTSHVSTFDDGSRRRPVVVVSRQTSAGYCRDRQNLHVVVTA